MKRRTFMGGVGAGLLMPALAKSQEITVPFGFPRPWGQVLRTFGDPVMEGHFSIRVFPSLERGSMVMWDRGDRILGMGSITSASSVQLWGVIEAILGRKPDVEIGPGAYMFRGDHYETAHWQLEDSFATRIGRIREAQMPHVASWRDPSRVTATAIRPLSSALRPPNRSEATHWVWVEPAPDVPGGPTPGTTIRLGSGQDPEMEAVLARISESNALVTPIDSQVALRHIAKMEPLIPFGATLTRVENPDGSLWGRCRILSI